MADDTRAAPAWQRPWAFGDVTRQSADKGAWQPSRAAERAYERQLRGVAGQVQHVLKTADPERAVQLLQEYARTIEPWARQSAANMVAGAARKNEQAWRGVATRMGLDIRLFQATDLGHVVSARIDANVGLIRSMVTGAAEQVASMVQESMASGMRAEELARRIADVGEVSLTRARTIAATEVSKAGTALTQARAASVGSEGYIWRTTRDGQTRPSHRAMEGRFIRWDSPPTLDNMTGHAGEFPNCRCYPEPVIANDAGERLRAPLPTAEEEQATGSHVLRSHWERQPGSTVVPHMEGTPLEGAASAAFDLRKATAYALSSDSQVGQNKARVFRAALGMGPEHAEELRRQVMGLMPLLPAERGRADEYGERFNVVIPVTGPNGRTVAVLTSWIYDRTSNAQRLAPRLVSMRVQ